jgi:hypothetical protein
MWMERVREVHGNHVTSVGAKYDRRSGPVEDPSVRTND